MENYIQEEPINPIDNLVKSVSSLDKPPAPPKDGSWGVTDSRDTQQAASEVLKAQVAQVLAEGALRQDSAKELSMARTRTSAASTEVGIKSIREYVVGAGGSRNMGVGIFGDAVDTVNADGSVTTTRGQRERVAPAPELNTKAIIDRKAEGIKVFNLEAELAKYEGLPAESRGKAASTLLVNIEGEITSQKAKIVQNAEMRAGVTNAQAALDASIAEDQIWIQTGRMRPTDVTLQTEQARKALGEAQIVAHRMAEVNVGTDVGIRRLISHQELLVKSIGKMETAEIKAGEKAANRESNQISWDDERLANAKLMLGIKSDDPKVIMQKAQNEYDKDKIFKSMINVTKEELPIYMASPEIRHRQLAAKMIETSERIALGVDPDTPIEKLPEDQRKILTEIRKMVTEPESILYPEEKAKLLTIMTTTIGDDKEKARKKAEFIAQALGRQIQKMGKDKYQRAETWTFTNPSIKMVVDGQKSLNKDGKISMNDAVTAVINADIKNADGTSMSRDEKTVHLMKSLEVTLDNDKKSMILPSAALYKLEYQAALKQQINVAFIRKMRNEKIIDDSGVMGERLGGAIFGGGGM